MGPPRERDGVRPRRHSSPRAQPASMGPPRERDGVSTRTTSEGQAVSSFNGAAARTRRSVLCTRRRSPPTRGASMGPPRERDGVMLPGGCLNGRPDQASMGPPRERDGVGGYCDITYIVAVASMGPPRERDGVGRGLPSDTRRPMASMGPPRERDGVGSAKARETRGEGASMGPPREARTAGPASMGPGPPRERDPIEACRARTSQARRPAHRRRAGEGAGGSWGERRRGLRWAARCSAICYRTWGPSEPRGYADGDAARNFWGGLSAFGAHLDSVLRSSRLIFVAKGIQISAPISKETKALLEDQVKASGVKKGHLIETALRYHLRALQELPADVLIPPRLVLTRRSFEQLVERLRAPGQPVKALRDLMRGDGD